MTDKTNTIKLIQLEIEAKEKAIFLIDQIITVAEKFDGKVANKRFGTALKKIDNNLKFAMEYNSFKIELYIDNRFLQTETHTEYIKNSYVSIIHGSISSSYWNSLLINSRIDGTELVAQLIKAKKELTSWVLELKSQVEKIDSILTAYQGIKDQIEKFGNDVNYTIRDYFQLDFKR